MMRKLGEIAKTSFLRYFPDSMVQLAKRYHYYRFLKKVNGQTEKEFRVIRGLVHQGNTVADIGANIGVYTRFLSQLVGPLGTVASFEPIPETFKILCESIRMLRAENVIPVNCAVSDADGMVEMVVPSYESGGKNYYRASIAAQEESRDTKLRKYGVKCTRFDTWQSTQNREISFLKIDVEGHEEKVISGAVETIRRSGPALLMEISCSLNDADCYGCAITEQLRQQGYERFWFDGTHLRRDVSPEEVANYFFLQEKHKVRLQAVDRPLFGP